MSYIYMHIVRTAWHDLQLWLNVLCVLSRLPTENLVLNLLDNNGRVHIKGKSKRLGNALLRKHFDFPSLIDCHVKMLLYLLKHVINLQNFVITVLWIVTPMARNFNLKDVTSNSKDEAFASRYF